MAVHHRAPAAFVMRRHPELVEGQRHTSGLMGRCVRREGEWAHSDSNQGPNGYEPSALPLSYGPAQEIVAQLQRCSQPPASPSAVRGQTGTKWTAPHRPPGRVSNPPMHTTAPCHSGHKRRICCSGNCRAGRLPWPLSQFWARGKGQQRTNSVTLSLSKGSGAPIPSP